MTAVSAGAGDDAAVELARLAHAADETGVGWYTPASLVSQIDMIADADREFIAACSPDVILALVQALADALGQEDTPREKLSLSVAAAGGLAESAPTGVSTCSISRSGWPLDQAPACASARAEVERNYLNYGVRIQAALSRAVRAEEALRQAWDDVLALGSVVGGERSTLVRVALDRIDAALAAAGADTPPDEDALWQASRDQAYEAAAGADTP